MSIDFPNDPTGRELVTLVERLKYERWISDETEAILDAAFNKALDVLLSSKYRDLTPFQKQRAVALYKELNRIITDSYGRITDLHVDQMKQFASLEAEATRDSVSSILAASDVAGISFGPSLPKNYLASIAKLPIQGLNIGEWFDAQARTMTLETRRIIQQGLIDGIGNAAIARKILAPAKTEGAVLSRRAKSGARAISRTIVNAVQNDAQFASISSLPDDVSDRYVYEVVLDSRTTPICRALSGNVYRYDDPRGKRPPQHVACRSSIRALLKGVDEPMAAQSQPKTIRNYETYLKTQSIGAQDAILGRTRASFWRDGKMSLADAIDGDNRVLTLPQLREKYESMAGAE